ncbi:hypothetical protein BC829DRAFT_444498 [Chytridium lagenaria]|nr:hypothetical protein BC829DRAFT_444498 [Chytridium lagenaria]
MSPNEPSSWASSPSQGSFDGRAMGAENIKAVLDASIGVVAVPTSSSNSSLLMHPSTSSSTIAIISTAIALTILSSTVILMFLCPRRSRNRAPKDILPTTTIPTITTVSPSSSPHLYHPRPFAFRAAPSPVPSDCTLVDAIHPTIPLTGLGIEPTITASFTNPHQSSYTDPSDPFLTTSHLPSSTLSPFRSESPDLPIRTSIFRSHSPNPHRPTSSLSISSITSQPQPIINPSRRSKPGPLKEKPSRPRISISFPDQPSTPPSRLRAFSFQEHERRWSRPNLGRKSALAIHTHNVSSLNPGVYTFESPKRSFDTDPVIVVNTRDEKEREEWENAEAPDTPTSMQWSDLEVVEVVEGDVVTDVEDEDEHVGVRETKEIDQVGIREPKKALNIKLRYVTRNVVNIKSKYTKLRNVVNVKSTLVKPRKASSNTYLSKFNSP